MWKLAALVAQLIPENILYKIRVTPCYNGLAAAEQSEKQVT